VLSAGSKKRATCEEGGSCDSLCTDQPHFTITFTSSIVVSESVQTQPHFLLENRNVAVKKAVHNVTVDIKTRNLDSAMLIHWLNGFFAKDSKEHAVCSAHSVWPHCIKSHNGLPTVWASLFTLSSSLMLSNGQIKNLLGVLMCSQHIGSTQMAMSIISQEQEYLVWVNNKVPEILFKVQKPAIYFGK
jgi:hypothetical protein